MNQKLNSFVQGHPLKFSQLFISQLPFSALFLGFCFALLPRGGGAKSADCNQPRKIARGVAPPHSATPTTQKIMRKNSEIKVKCLEIDIKWRGRLG